MLKAKQQQDELLKDRALMFASETRKVENLRALRLAKMESAKPADGEADTIVPAAAKRRLRALPQAKAATLQPRG
jgi:hypothetical protein